MGGSRDTASGLLSASGNRKVLGTGTESGKGGGAERVCRRKGEVCAHVHMCRGEVL